MQNEIYREQEEQDSRTSGSFIRQIGKAVKGRLEVISARLAYDIGAPLNEKQVQVFNTDQLRLAEIRDAMNQQSVTELETSQIQE